MEYLLSHSGKTEDKQAAWNGWYRELKSLVANYSNNLPLAAEAAKENGRYYLKYLTQITRMYEIMTRVFESTSNVRLQVPKMLRNIGKCWQDTLMHMRK